jgi:ABC-type multidrug transport system permease subunit
MVFWIMMVLALIAFEGWQLSKLIKAVCVLLSDKKQIDAEEDDEEQEKAEILKDEAYLATWFICPFVVFGLIYASLISLISFTGLLLLTVLFSVCMGCLGKWVA